MLATPALKKAKTNGLRILRVQLANELTLLAISGMGADSKSSLGTAFAFSRPNNLALSLSNTSLLLEYTSRVFINSLQETGDNNRIKRQERQLMTNFKSISLINICRRELFRGNVTL